MDSGLTSSISESKLTILRHSENATIDDKMQVQRCIIRLVTLDALDPICTENVVS